jgi:putative ABC transport system permease protein
LTVSFFSFTIWQNPALEQAWYLHFSVFLGLAIRHGGENTDWGGGARHFFPRKWPYVWRQGFFQLISSPNNQTLILILTIGLGTALIATL